jgi:hypothetical protein
MFRNRGFILRKMVVHTGMVYIVCCSSVVGTWVKTAYTDACKTQYNTTVQTSVFLELAGRVAQSV